MLFSGRKNYKLHRLLWRLRHLYDSRDDPTLSDRSMLDSVEPIPSDEIKGASMARSYPSTAAGSAVGYGSAEIDPHADVKRKSREDSAERWLHASSKEEERSEDGGGADVVYGVSGEL